MSKDEPWTIKRLLDWTKARLESKGAGSSARVESELLLAFSLSCRKIDLYTRLDEVPTDPQMVIFRDLVQRRSKGAPVAHLVKKKEFFSLEFEVGPDVLIPRADSETLVMQCCELAKPLSQPKLLDLGTGSGCLAIAIAHALTKRSQPFECTAVDLSDKALAVAQRNATKHKLTEKIRFLQGDLFSTLTPGESFDIIFSNPPYIPTKDIATLAVDVRDFEPKLALDGGSDGFSVIDRILAEFDPWLKPGGWLVMEIGYDQEEAGRKRFERVENLKLGKTIRDSGGHPRVLLAQKLTELPSAPVAATPVTETPVAETPVVDDPTPVLAPEEAVSPRKGAKGRAKKK